MLQLSIILIQLFVILLKYVDNVYGDFLKRQFNNFRKDKQWSWSGLGFPGFLIEGPDKIMNSLVLIVYKS